MILQTSHRQNPWSATESSPHSWRGISEMAENLIKPLKPHGNISMNAAKKTSNKLFVDSIHVWTTSNQPRDFEWWKFACQRRKNRISEEMRFQNIGLRFFRPRSYYQVYRIQFLDKSHERSRISHAKNEPNSSVKMNCVTRRHLAFSVDFVADSGRKHYLRVNTVSLARFRAPAASKSLQVSISEKWTLGARSLKQAIRDERQLLKERMFWSYFEWVRVLRCFSDSKISIISPKLDF